ncbi:putative methyltransferase [Capsicum chinense]|nr:putative methyltransferase [Capsicum chinense]
MRRSIALCRGGVRSYCTDAGDGFQSSKLKIFDRHLKRKQRGLNTCASIFPDGLSSSISIAVRGGIEKLIMMDTSWDMVKLCKDAEQKIPNDNIETSYIIGDEEYLPVKENSVDLVISCLGLHWTNDLPGAMIQCRLCLKPDGLFLEAILGGETLKELRIACTIAQMEREGGISPRLSPLTQVRDAGNLLTRAGFTLPGVDVDEYTVQYRVVVRVMLHALVSNLVFEQTAWQELPVHCLNPSLDIN